jgi:hypothetical protein
MPVPKTQQARLLTPALNTTTNMVNLATRMPPSSSMLPTSSPGGAPATGPRVVRGFTWQGGGPAIADSEAGEP